MVLWLYSLICVVGAEDSLYPDDASPHHSLQAPHVQEIVDPRGLLTLGDRDYKFFHTDTLSQDLGNFIKNWFIVK